MTITDAVLRTGEYLRAFNLNGWKVKVIERFTAPQLADLIGYCERPDKTIWLTRAAIERPDALETIQHEVAHCLQPPEQFTSEALAHGDDFERALAEVRKVDMNAATRT
jgi:hypothetical protein